MRCPVFRMAFTATLLVCSLQSTTGLEDFSFLLQTPSATGIPAGGVFLNEEASKNLWPDLDSLWKEVQESVGQVTSQVGEVTDNAVNKVDQISRAIQVLSADIAEKVASALNHALDFVKKEADRLLFDTMQEKAGLFEKMHDAVDKRNESIVVEFKKAANKMLVAAWGRWQTLKGLVDKATDMISGGLRAAGQGWLASKVHLMIHSAESNLDIFMDELKAADDELMGLEEKEYTQVQATLTKINSFLNRAMQQVPTFIAKFQGTFQEITEKLCSALLLSSEDVDAAFATVAQNITSIGWRLRSSGRELLLGVHRSIVMVANALNFTAPPWEPMAPVDLQVGWSGASTFQSPFLAIALLAFGAALRQ